MNKEKDFTEKQMEPEKKGNKSKKFFHSARFKHGGMATAFTAGFIVVVILINVIVSDVYKRQHFQLHSFSFLLKICYKICFLSIYD